MDRASLKLSRQQDRARQTQSQRRCPSDAHHRKQLFGNDRAELEARHRHDQQDDRQCNRIRLE
jgi:hypothetical protein